MGYPEQVGDMNSSNHILQSQLKCDLRFLPYTHMWKWQLWQTRIYLLIVIQKGTSATISTLKNQDVRCWASCVLYNRTNINQFKVLVNSFGCAAT